MARFSISPGVSTREVDQSQYAATTPGTGNIAALVGYTEKGPFEPTVVTSQQDFNKKFGYTLKEVPYLAQAAYKYFEEGSRLLITRMGDDRDPILYPSAAQYASKTIRIEPQSTSSAGSQSFKATSNVAAGSYLQNTQYTFRVNADFRGFKTPKYLEKWEGVTVETANNIGRDSPATSVADAVFKLAATNSSSNTFEVHYKRDQSAGSTSEYYGADGVRSGSTLGSTISANIFQYRDNDTYADIDGDFITISGKYGAVAVGNTNITSGHDWSTTAQRFVLTVGVNAYTITLNTECANAASVVDAINTALTVADLSSVSTDISSQFQAFIITPVTGTSYIAIKRMSGSGSGFSISSGSPNALSTLGLTAAIYLDADYISGEWHAEYPHPLPPSNPAISTFDGLFVFKKIATENGATSFQDAVTVNITSPAGGAWTLSDIVTNINSALDHAYSTYNFPAARARAFVIGGKVVITAEGEASPDFSSFVTISPPTSGNSAISLLGGVDEAKAGVAPLGMGETLITLRAKEKGSFGNFLTLRVETQNILYGSQVVEKYNVYVLWDGKEVSVYQKVDWTDPTSANYVLTKMSSDPYIRLESADEDTDLTYAKLPDGDWSIGDMNTPSGVSSTEAIVIDSIIGTNGWTQDDQGVITSMDADVIKALDKISNPEVFDFNLVAAPGGADTIIQMAVQSLADSRRDCFGVVDAAPFGIGLGIKDSTNNITEVTAACDNLTSSYVGAFWPWCLDYDADNKQNIWLPPSIYALRQMVYTDNIADPWFAPAGTTRGRVGALDVEYSPSKSDRDFLYGDQNIVNPIVKFVSEGITIWGQKTAQRTNTATNRINVRRLLIYAEKLIARMARGFLFEPNDTANYSAFARQANAILEPIRQRRGLYTYTVVCDETTNPAELVNQNIMAGKIFLQPTKTIEFIEVEFTVNAAGEVTIAE